MRIQSVALVFCTVALVSCGTDHFAGSDQVDQRSELPSIGPRSPGSRMRAIEFDIIQRTCALYVAVRSGSFETPAAFDRDIDETMVRWNMCDSGTMVACVKTPTANGDTIRSGIPWPYDLPRH